MIDFTAILPEFDAIDDVLPKDVAAGTDRGHRIEVSIGHPDGEGGILLEGGLTAADLFAQVTADAAADEEEHETEHEAEQGYHDEQGEACLAVDDVAHGDARGDTELGSPEIEREIGDGDNPGTEALGIVLHEPAEGEGQHEDDSQFLENDEEGTPEIEARTALEQGEHSGNHQGGGKGG